MFRKILIVKVCILFLCIFCTVSGVAPTSVKEPYNGDEKRLTKRGYFGELNEYGPPVHISSSVLQLENKPEFDFNEHRDIIHENSGESSLQQSPIWNTIAIGYQPSHKVFDTSNDEYLQHSNLGGSSFSHDSSSNYPGSHSGLHTQIISSSGLDISHLNDKLDTNDVVDINGKHYIKSYG